MSNTRAMVSRLVVTALAVTSLTAQSARTHTFLPDRFYNTFSAAHPPALRIKPGERVVTKTLDAAGIDWNGKQVGLGPNPQTGPFFVEGAEPGDMLVVSIEKLETNRGTGVLEQPARSLCRRSRLAHRARRSRAATRDVAARQNEGHGTARRHRAGAAGTSAPPDARMCRCRAGAQGGDHDSLARARSAATWTTPG